MAPFPRARLEVGANGQRGLSAISFQTHSFADGVLMRWKGKVTPLALGA